MRALVSLGAKAPNTPGNNRLTHAKKNPQADRLRVAGRTGLEPAAGVTGRRYNQLNYRPSGVVSSGSWGRFDKLVKQF